MSESGVELKFVVLHVVAGPSVPLVVSRPVLLLFANLLSHLPNDIQVEVAQQ